MKMVLEKIDNLTFNLKSNSPKYNRYKVGHPAGFLEAFANLYTDIYDELYNFKKNIKSKKHERVFNIKNSEKIAKFFHSASKSNKINSWVKI